MCCQDNTQPLMSMNAPNPKQWQRNSTSENLNGALPLRKKTFLTTLVGLALPRLRSLWLWAADGLVKMERNDPAMERPRLPRTQPKTELETTPGARLGMSPTGTHFALTTKGLPLKSCNWMTPQMKLAGPKKRLCRSLLAGPLILNLRIPTRGPRLPTPKPLAMLRPPFLLQPKIDLPPKHRGPTKALDLCPPKTTLLSVTCAKVCPTESWSILHLSVSACLLGRCTLPNLLEKTCPPRLVTTRPQTSLVTGIFSPVRTTSI